MDQNIWRRGGQVKKQKGLQNRKSLTQATKKTNTEQMGERIGKRQRQEVESETLQWRESMTEC